jgi:putative transposase
MNRHERGARLRWAELRFSIIGTLLSSPAEPGELAERLLELAERQYTHPSSGEPVRFGVSTIERWYYQARAAQQPIVALERKVPKHAGSHPSVSGLLASAIAAQHAQHPSWSYQLHYDNLSALVSQTPSLGPLPSYPTLRRYMKDTGLLRAAKRRPKQRDGRSHDTALQVQAREVRSYEHAYVHGLWHLDFHEGSRKVLLPSGAWSAAHLLCVLDDCSRLCCHAQWYLANDTEALVHALCQAILKRGLPRALMSDNGSAMTAAETTEGLSRLSVLHQLTLPYSPEQNGKQESFFARIEGRLLPMLEGERALTLALLNDATQAWVEQEYHQSVHSELGQTPLSRALAGKSVVRPSPSSDALRRAFKTECSRAQRKSDGTVSVEGVRFEVPSRYRTLSRCTLRVARWDLRSVDLCDPHSGVHLATLLPLDKHKNADGRRRAIRIASAQEPEPQSGIAPLLRELMAQYSATGLPPAYLTHDDDPHPDTDPQENDEP